MGRVRHPLSAPPEALSKNSRDRLAHDAPALAADYNDLFAHPGFVHFWGMLEEAHSRLTNRLVEMDWDVVGDQSLRDTRVALNTIKQVMAIPGIVESTAEMQTATSQLTGNEFSW